jgi:leader peptidase (prepilin peptidase)/N-methyltransferase
MPITLAALGGLITGSFLNVVAYRLPRGESLWFPGSHCQSCGGHIKPYDNVPVVGWLMLRGQCRSCGDRISARYPVIEALTALLAVAVVLTKHSARDIILGLVLVGTLVPVALIDLDRRIIPNKITLPAAVAAVAIGLLTAPAKVPEQLIAGAAAGGFLLLFALIYPRGMGMGDVKLALLIGFMLGRTVPIGMFAGFVSSLVPSLVLFARHGMKARKMKIPFAPFLALGGLVGLFLGHPLLDWYLSLSR